MATGSISHIEFPADDLDRAKQFYGAVAGWEFNEMEGLSDYWLFRSSETTGGGLGKRGATVGNVVRVYIDVDDLDAAIAAAEANGGSVVTPPSPVPGYGRFAAVLDPEGNEVGLFETSPAAGRAGRGARPYHPRVRLVDSHCHLNAERFEDDASEVADAARASGVERILVPGWNVASSSRALDLVTRTDWLDAAVGVHPHDAAKVD